MNGDSLAKHEHTQQRAIMKGVSLRVGIKGISLPVIATCLTALIKYLTKATKGGKIGLVSQWEGRVHPDRESMAAEAEAAAHIASMVKKKTEEHWCSSAFLFVFSPGPQPMDWCHPDLG